MIHYIYEMSPMAWLDSPQGNIDFDTPYRIRDHWHPITFQ